MGIPSNTAASADMVAAKTAPLRIWHCSHPRTASNVLVKQFRDHPKLAPKEYPFLTAFLYGPERLDEQGGDRKPPDADKATFQNCFDELQDLLASAEQQEHVTFMLDPRVMAAKFPPTESRPLKPCPKVVDRTASGNQNSHGSVQYNGEGSKTNPTVLPDSFVRTLSPIFQIRHPAISIPSFYRAVTSITPEKDLESQEFHTNCSLAWPRITFDWFCEHVYPQRRETLRGHTSWPLVVDGDDLLNENERVITAICSLAQLDPTGIVKTWNPISEEIQQHQPDHIRRFLSTLQASNGIIKSGLKGEDIVIEEEAQKWVKEFGHEIANKLKEAVEASMEDYLYLAQFRI
ncbi:MAG: hypothetical protein Q9192_005896 [Flavoplaca navasiana]